jgi:phosphatidylglycerol:prolipoprotein diacylglycerol transferase
VYPVLFNIGAIFIPSYGALAAVGVLLALFLAQRNARVAGISPAQVWNLSITALFAALVGSRLLLILVNWRNVVSHPIWILSLAMVHHPLLASAGAFVGLVAAALYARSHHLPLANTADTLAAPVALGLACEQCGALLAGSGFGKGTNLPWAVTYTNPLAFRWSGAPLGIPLHPVQGYAGILYLTLAILLLVWLPARRQVGDVAGVALMGSGTVIYITEFWRDWEGRGDLFHGVLDGPQAISILLVIAGAVILRERASFTIAIDAQNEVRVPTEAPHD